MLNMEENHLILNGMHFNSNIIEEFIGLKLPDYQFMKYIKSFVDSKDVTQHTCSVVYFISPTFHLHKFR